MATVPISTIIKRVNTHSVDPTFTRWPKQELLDYYNDAIAQGDHCWFALTLTPRTLSLSARLAPSRRCHPTPCG